MAVPGLPAPRPLDPESAESLWGTHAGGPAWPPRFMGRLDGLSATIGTTCLSDGRQPRHGEIEVMPGHRRLQILAVAHLDQSTGDAPKWRMA
jgi:hypothetical protein